ncbi:hypothetical protein D0817_16855 [Flavobacterium cupreum]|uniref:RiboL-PSP-HEPN domain-containing protein n=1 Tax=Flavobacterium cupreum TaxID=2133766 RepID=A0A434A448_9FLAO|nr:hypothetical protein [Flavobacterium cupreum]RUT69179.1 hypothetical protein D0817_16855 [Flavobacterium cupreum]
MTTELKNKIQGILTVTSIKILKDYTSSALMLNACHLAIEKYNDPDRKILLSTTANIHEDLRLKPEIEEQLTNNLLIEKYSKEVPTKIFEYYVLNSVSVVDAAFEDVYETILQEYENSITEKQISDRIRNAWTNDNFIDYFINKTGIEDKSNPQKRIKETFDRYKEYRIIRHALLHNKGVLSDKHMRQLEEIHEATDEDSKFKTMKNLPFYTDKKVELTRDRFLSIRKFLYQFIYYFILALE